MELYVYVQLIKLCGVLCKRWILPAVEELEGNVMYKVGNVGRVVRCCGALLAVCHFERVRCNVFFIQGMCGHEKVKRRRKKSPRVWIVMFCELKVHVIVLIHAIHGIVVSVKQLLELALRRCVPADLRSH